MKMTKLTCTLALALVCGIAVTGCGHRTGKMTNIPGRTPLAPPEPPSGNTMNAGGGDQSGPISGAEDRATLAGATIYFNYDSAAIKKAERSKLEEVARALSTDRGAKLKIEGNCDERGTEEYNRSLGEKRALAARGALVKMGISASRIATISNGKDKPAVEGNDEASRSKNRRDEFVIIHEGAGGPGGS